MSAPSYRAYRPRPAPRRRGPGGRPRSRIDWERVGRIALVLVVFAVLVSYLNPVVNFVDAWRDSHAERARYQELAQENQRLREREATLDDSETLEREARKLGMIAVGERSYSIRGLKR